jgi:hypothetical protein
MAHYDRMIGPPGLAGRARRAYERGRLLAGLRRAAPVALLVAVVALHSDQPLWRLCVGGAAAIACALAFARGRLVGRAARAGFLAALPPLAAPFLLALLHHGCFECGGPPLALCLGVCGGAGVAAGAVMTTLAAREERAERWRFAAIAALLAAWLGALGCGFAGALGLAGMAGGLVAGSVRMLTLTRAR